MQAIVVEYLEDIPASDQWRLVRDVSFWVDPYGLIVVPEGYITDFASSPPLIWSIIPSIGKYNRAALVHDFLYENRIMGFEKIEPKEARLIADKAFLEIANRINPDGKLKHWLMYQGIRIFGKRRFLV